VPAKHMAEQRKKKKEKKKGRSRFRAARRSSSAPAESGTRRYSAADFRGQTRRQVGLGSLRGRRRGANPLPMWARMGRTSARRVERFLSRKQKGASFRTQIQSKKDNKVTIRRGGTVRGRRREGDRRREGKNLGAREGMDARGSRKRNLEARRGRTGGDARLG